MDRLRVGVVVPALNEAQTIGDVVGRLVSFSLPIVVDDGSTDATAAIAKAGGAEVVSHDRNRGYDAALNSGFKRAAELGCAYVVTIDADGQLPADRVPDYIAALDGGADLVIGIRDTVPRISERAFKAMTRLMYGIDDPLCGMKGYRMELYNSLGWFDSYGSVGTELMLHAARRNAGIVQIAIPTKPRIGAARFGNILRANWLIFRAAATALGRHFS